MVLQFKNDEDGYLAWVRAHPSGFVVNVDEPQYFPQYPMVHTATHRLISSDARTNYTTGRYQKFCSESLEELEQWSLRQYGRPLSRCVTCM